MCGIAGFMSSTPPSEGVLNRMLEAIWHRGPDEGGVYVDATAAVGMRRLSIIDLASGHQPMTNEDGSLEIVYNGEVFNHAAIRPELESAGHQYKTRCDTETILHAFEAWGPGCLSRFRGMFAFAIWNKRDRRLFIARDRLGIKPLYYYWDGRLFAFASEIKALLAHPAISAKVEESCLPEYLAFGYTSDDRTLFAGIRKLRPGHHLQLDWSAATPELRIEQYWDVPRPGSFEQRSDQEWIAECRQRLEETVRMRLMSDVPLGMFLSGGVDSSAIAALMKTMVSGRIQTFSVGYNEAQYSELGYARRVAETLGTDHHETIVTMESFFDALPKLIWHEDEPITWPSSVSLYFVSQLAAKNVKVVLTGEGSDELFGGYERYGHHEFNTEWLRRYSIVPSGVRSAIRNYVAASSLISRDLRRKIQHTFVGRNETTEALYFDNFYCAFPAPELSRLLPQGETDAQYRNVLDYWNTEPQTSFLSRMLYSDQKSYLVELLMKQDQMSMATSLESRVPFLDHPLVEFASRVPDHMKRRGGAGKYILKKAVEDLLPHDIIYRKKMGFPTPLRGWLRDHKSKPLADLLLRRDGLLAEYLNRAAIEDLLEKQQSAFEDATDRIWRLLNLQVWGDIHITGRRDAVMDGLFASTAAHTVA